MDSKTILLVDDAAMVIRLTSHSLKKAGYKVITAGDGNEALTHLNGQEVDLLITDLNMPGKDGIALIHTMRAMPYYRFLPVVLFASAPYTNIEDDIRTSQATILFDKEWIKDKLISTVNKLIDYAAV